MQLIFEELRRIVVEIEMPELDRFIELRRKINDVMLQLLEECLLPTNKMVKNLVIVQDAYINTYHPDFMGGANSVFNMFDQEKQNEVNNQNPKTPGRLNVESMEDGPPSNQD